MHDSGAGRSIACAETFHARADGRGAYEALQPDFGDPSASPATNARSIAGKPARRARLAPQTGRLTIRSGCRLRRELALGDNRTFDKTWVLPMRLSQTGE